MACFGDAQVSAMGKDEAPGQTGVGGSGLVELNDFRQEKDTNYDWTNSLESLEGYGRLAEAPFFGL